MHSMGRWWELTGMMWSQPIGAEISHPFIRSSSAAGLDKNEKSVYYSFLDFA